MSDSPPETETDDEYVWVDLDEGGEHATVEIGPIPIDALPGIARIAAVGAFRGWAWSIGTGLRAGRRLTEAALSGESASQLIDEVREETVHNLRAALGVVDGSAGSAAAEDPSPARARARKEDVRRRQVASLRERGAELFERASQVDVGDEPIHPGFERIIDQLAPDEARILKLLINEGPQAIVYVNRATVMGLGAREVARRLTLAGREAGCLRPELVPAYLDNLVRLGLVAIRRDPIDDESAYQVLEAQPEVVEAMKSVNEGIFRGQSSRRSVHISEYGKSFCQICFPAEQLTGEIPEVVPAEAIEVPPPDQDLDGRDRQAKGA